MPEKFRRTAGKFRPPVGKYSGHHHPTFGARGQEHTPRTSNTPSRYLVECLRGRTGASCTRGPLSPFKYLLPPIIGLKKKRLVTALDIEMLRRDTFLVFISFDIRFS